MQATVVVGCGDKRVEYGFDSVNAATAFVHSICAVQPKAMRLQAYTKVVMGVIVSDLNQAHELFMKS